VPIKNGIVRGRTDPESTGNPNSQRCQLLNHFSQRCRFSEKKREIGVRGEVPSTIRARNHAITHAFTMYTYSPSKPRDIIESNVLERNTMRYFLLVFLLLLLRSLGRRQRGDAPPRKCRCLVATTAAAAFSHAHGTHAMGNKGCGGGTPSGTICPW
jgi:hypothetical protein